MPVNCSVNAITVPAPFILPSYVAFVLAFRPE